MEKGTYQVQISQMGAFAVFLLYHCDIIYLGLWAPKKRSIPTDVIKRLEINMIASVYKKK